MFTTITTAGRRGLVIVLTVCSLAIPASATAFYGSAQESGAAGNRSAGNPARDSGLVIPDHSALDASLAPVSGSGDARGVGQPPCRPYSIPLLSAIGSTGPTRLSVRVSRWPWLRSGPPP